MSKSHQLLQEIRNEISKAKTQRYQNAPPPSQPTQPQTCSALATPTQCSDDHSKTATLFKVEPTSSTAGFFER